MADAYKQDLQVASNKYLEDVGNAANPKTKFITTYSFDDSIIKDNKKWFIKENPLIVWYIPLLDT